MILRIQISPCFESPLLAICDKHALGQHDIPPTSAPTPLLSSLFIYRSPGGKSAINDWPKHEHLAAKENDYDKVRGKNCQTIGPWKMESRG